MQYQKELEYEFKHLAPYHHRYKVWDDFITCFAISLNNSVAPDTYLEEKYLTIINQYERDDRFKFAKLAGLLVMAFEESGYCDLLGELYMKMEISSKNLGQFFTPYSVSKVCALLSMDKKKIERQRYITVHEPASGSGGMVVALADAMHSEGYNPQQQLLAHCVDVDQTAAMMCYVQLTLFGIPARVTIGNTLTMQFSRTMATPMYHLGGWALKEVIGQERPESETTRIVKEAKEIIKHCSDAKTETSRSEILSFLAQHSHHQRLSIIKGISRVVINDETYDLLSA